MSLQSPWYRIGEAARLSGVSVANIRFYEKQGLLPASARGDNQYRLYDDADLHRLRFVRLCRAMDMSLDEVRSLLALDGNSPASAHQACLTLDAHLHHVRERLHELQALELALQDLRSRCAGAQGACHVLAALHERADAAPVAPTDAGCGAKPSAASPHKRHV